MSSEFAQPEQSDDPDYEYWGLIGSSWDLFRGDTSNWGDRRRYRELIEQYGQPVLVVGCGTGRLLLDYLGAGIDVDGVDNSPEMLAPTLAVPALDAGASYITKRIAVGGEQITRREHVMTLPFNICNRLPVLNVPSGLASSGIPTGVQIIGNPWDEASVFVAGYAIEQLKPWADTHPPL